NKHALGLATGAEIAFELRILGEADESRVAIAPALAAVAAAHHAVDFDRRVKIARRLRIEGDAHHATRKRHLHMLGQHRLRQALPMRAAILAAIDADRRGAGIDRLRLPRMDEKGPDLD